jgi:hypothetical protein
MTVWFSRPEGTNDAQPAQRTGDIIQGEPEPLPRYRHAGAGQTESALCLAEASELWKHQEPNAISAAEMIRENRDA